MGIAGRSPRGLADLRLVLEAARDFPHACVATTLAQYLAGRCLPWAKGPSFLEGSRGLRCESEARGFL